LDQHFQNKTVNSSIAKKETVIQHELVWGEYTEKSRIWKLKIAKRTIDLLQRDLRVSRTILVGGDWRNVAKGGG